MSDFSVATICADDLSPSLTTIVSARRIVLGWDVRYSAVGGEERLREVNRFYNSAAAPEPGPAFEVLRKRLAAHAPIAPERLALPYYGLREPCSLLYDEIETIWAAIDERDDWGPLDAKLAAIAELRSANPELVGRGRQS